MTTIVRSVFAAAGLVLLVVAAAMVAAPLGVAAAGVAALVVAADARPQDRR